MSEASSFLKLKTEFTDMAKFPGDSESKINTQEFVAACSALVNLVVKLGNTFKPIILDMNHNIQIIYGKFLENPTDNQYLVDMILKEQQASRRSITLSVMWLRRDLQFFNLFFAIVLEDTRNRGGALLNLTEYVITAYQHTIQPFKGWDGIQLIRMLCRKYPPNRTNYITILALGRRDIESQVIVEWKAYYQQLNGCIQKMLNFYVEHNLEMLY